MQTIPIYAEERLACEEGCSFIALNEVLALSDPMCKHRSLEGKIGTVVVGIGARSGECAFKSRRIPKLVFPFLQATGKDRCINIEGVLILQ